MKTNPFYDSWLFLLGRTDDHNNAGPFFAWILTLGFLALIGASIWIARTNWREDPGQRTVEHLGIWAMRFLIGAMWFQGSLWKLPLPISGGLDGWTRQLAENAAFGVHSWIATNIFIPGLVIINPLVYLTELSLGIAFILGFLVRPMAVIGMLFTLHLWLGLYRHPAEWPWLYIFLVFVQGFFFLTNAGKSLGLDALMARRPWGPLKGDGPIASLYRRVA
jgi:uncharacterized membrane protein YphA (DoxX/SURF4 family)